MTNLVALPMLVPLIAAGISVILGRWRWAQRVVALAALTATLGISIALAISADRDGPLVVQAGGRPAPIGITLVVDRLSGIMLTVGAAMLLAVLVYAIGQPGAERNHVGFQSLYLIMSAGVGASFIVGDMFTLFVAFEMMLTASYALLTLGGGREQVRSGMTYVVISLIASTLFVTALALLYAATGTLNMADLSEKMADLPPGLRTAFAVLLLVVFGIKAGLFPLFFWLPDSYPTAPSPVTAVFAGLLTKVGVYALIRTQTLLFPADSRPDTLMLVLAGLTMVIGILGAIAQDDVKRILSFNIISHIGYMIMGLALFSVAGIAAAVFYTVHHIVAKTTLFLTGGLIEHVGGSSRLSRLGNMVQVGAGRRRAVPRPGAHARRRAAAVGLHPQARAGGGRVRPAALPDRRDQPRRQPAHAAVDDEDLDRSVLGPRARGTGERAADRRPDRRPAADDRADGGARRRQRGHRRRRRTPLRAGPTHGHRPPRPGRVPAGGVADEGHARSPGPVRRRADRGLADAAGTASASPTPSPASSSPASCCWCSPRSAAAVTDRSARP